MLFTIWEVNFAQIEVYFMTKSVKFTEPGVYAVYDLGGKFYAKRSIFHDQKRKIYGAWGILILLFSVYLLRKFYAYEGT